MHKLEYLWLDGCTPTQIRHKTKVVKEFGKNTEAPVWGFDGSSTEQADGGSSDCVLKPVRVYPNPLETNSSIVLCEVYNVDDTPHESNTRRILEDTLISCNTNSEWVGFEQEYTLFENDRPLGWPSNGEPAPQGDYYCGRNHGEDIVKQHLDACITAGIKISGINSEVMLGQWEYQIGADNPLRISDDVWVARWLMEKICALYGIVVSLDPKPVEGDWNGAGAHTNFSTKAMRENGGDSVIYDAIKKLEKKHQEHIDVYGYGNEKRLTGLHETCDINTFRWGVSDRGASIRVPWQVHRDGKGYLEDRRPASNCDPYVVSQKLIETICS